MVDPELPLLAELPLPLPVVLVVEPEFPVVVEPEFPVVVEPEFPVGATIWVGHGGGRHAGEPPTTLLLTVTCQTRTSWPTRMAGITSVPPAGILRGSSLAAAASSRACASAGVARALLQDTAPALQPALTATNSAWTRIPRSVRFAAPIAFSE